MSFEEIKPEQSHKIKTSSINQFIDKLNDYYDPFPKTIQILVNIDSLKKSIIDISFIKPILFVFEKDKLKKFVSPLDLNDKLCHEILFLNLRKGI
jgi:hypothetical protein